MWSNSMPSAIIVNNLSKKYLLRHGTSEPYVALRDVLTRTVKNAGSVLLGKKPLFTRTKREEFWALRNISIDVKKGDRLGIIGRNGAGKSTLLKILSRITEPTTGDVRIRGRVASLLEVGTGFHPELTGKENIYLNGAILGMRKGEIKRKFDEIVDFAEIEKFLDTPVKHYSSGMYVRLAFAVAAHLEPEILIVDEVLAVGDAQFQKKCLGKMEDVSAKEGRTVLFVSHNMGAVTQLCQKGILIEKGEVDYIGSAENAVKKYVVNAALRGGNLERSFSGTLAETIKVRNIDINHIRDSQVVINSSEELEIVVEGVCQRQINNFVFTFSLYKDDIRLFTLHDTVSPKKLPEGNFSVMVTFPRFLLRPGEYSFAFGGKDLRSNDWLYGTYLKYIIVENVWSDENVEINYGLINVKLIKSYRMSDGTHI